MSRMYNPPHPGAVLKDTVLGAGRLSVTAFAEQLRVTRVTMSKIVNGRSAISADMALRLSEALGGSAESWLRMQEAYDLWQAKKKKRHPKIKRIQFPEPDRRAA